MFRRQDIFKKHAGGDGALSKQELEMLQAAQWGKARFSSARPGLAKTNTRMPLHHLWLARVRMHTCVRPAFASTWFHVLSCLSCLWFESVPTLACGLES